MGMYTGLRGKIKLKPEYAVKIKQEMDSEEYFCWENILPEGNKYHSYSRNSFIPFGAVCYIDWKEEPVELKDGVLSFTCSLKNYDDTIEVFLKECLPLIADSWNLEELYEEDITSTKHIKTEGEAT